MFSPEISFRYISADNSKIDTMLMSQKLSIDFLCAQTINTIIELDSLPVAFKEICFTKATVKQVTITNAEIDSLDVLEACIDTLEFKRCKFLGYSNIDGNIGKLCINDSLNFSVFKLSLIETKELAFSNTVNFAPFLSYHGAITWLDYVYTSGITFFAVGYGDLYPLNVVTKMVSLVEAFLGVTAMSYFLVLLSRKVIR